MNEKLMRRKKVEMQAENSIKREGDGGEYVM